MAELSLKFAIFRRDYFQALFSAECGNLDLLLDRASLRICLRVALPFVVLKYLSLRKASDFEVWASQYISLKGRRNLVLMFLPALCSSKRCSIFSEKPV